MAGFAQAPVAQATPEAASWTEQDLDARQKAIVARFPGGLTVAQFRQLCLESARADNIIHPPWVDMFNHGFPILMRMMMDGHIARLNHGPHKPILPYLITAAGRAALATMPPLIPGMLAEQVS